MHVNRANHERCEAPVRRSLQRRLGQAHTVRCILCELLSLTPVIRCSDQLRALSEEEAAQMLGTAISAQSFSHVFRVFAARQRAQLEAERLMNMRLLKGKGCEFSTQLVAELFVSQFD